MPQALCTDKHFNEVITVPMEKVGGEGGSQALEKLSLHLLQQEVMINNMIPMRIKTHINTDIYGGH